ncbi:DUF2025 family protein [Pseudomonas aeruginosa]
MRDAVAGYPLPETSHGPGIWRCSPLGRLRNPEPSAWRRFNQGRDNPSHLPFAIRPLPGRRQLRIPRLGTSDPRRRTGRRRSCVRPEKQGTSREVPHSITSTDICQAADALKGFVGFNRKTGPLHRAFQRRLLHGRSRRAASRPPASSSAVRVRDDVGAWAASSCRSCWEQNINERLNIGEPLLVHLRRQDLPEITA